MLYYASTWRIGMIHIHSHHWPSCVHTAKAGRLARFLDIIFICHKIQKRVLTCTVAESVQNVTGVL